MIIATKEQVFFMKFCERWLKAKLKCNCIERIKSNPNRGITKRQNQTQKSIHAHLHVYFTILKQLSEPK